MRTGLEYTNGLRDGRVVHIVGEGRVDDVTTHPATRNIVQSYADWYDQHGTPDSESGDILFGPAGTGGRRMPVEMMRPQNSDDLRRMGRAFDETLLRSAGNLTHDPAYGNLIAIGILDSVTRMNLSAEQVQAAADYRDLIEQEGRFITLAFGGAPVGYRFRTTPAERQGLHIVEEREDGLVIHGRIGMHSASPFVDDVYIGIGSGVVHKGYRASFAVAVNSPGVTLLARKVSAKHANPFLAPLSHRFDELDAQMWLDHVLVPWNRVFLAASADGPPAARLDQSTWAWVTWHQLYCWYAKGEFSLGLALALTEVMGLRANPRTRECLIDMMVELQAVRSALTAAELDPDWSSPTGIPAPNAIHLASGSIRLIQNQRKLNEILRTIPGSSMVIAPSDVELTDPLLASGLEESFGGGGYTAHQRAALLNLAWDHASSALDARESAFELHANGGVPLWRAKTQALFPDYDRLANGVLRALDIEFPRIDAGSFRETN